MTERRTAPSFIETHYGVEHDRCMYFGYIVFVGTTRVWFCNKCGCGAPLDLAKR